MADFIRVQMGTCAVYVIRGKGGNILVDAGNRGRERKLFRSLEKNGIQPEDISLIVVTHVHYDHVGALSAVRDRCGCPVAVHTRERSILESGLSVLPSGTNPFADAVLHMGDRLVERGIFGFKPVKADIIVEGVMDLQPFGIEGAVVPTPGHTVGSISVLLPDHNAFVGDTIMTFPYIPGYPIYPPFADDPGALLDTWEMLLNRNIRRLHQAHGGAVSDDQLRRAYESRRLKQAQ
ncbi:MAG: MBL fold metallo-hydrolase [Deltaproteobacteria bacterium]|nr:MBL fold metallo-hydrolase [Candidatus Zymogenaceae bacterium]